MAIVQQMFTASLDGAYWFSEYHATEDNNNRALFMGTLALDPAGFIYTSGMYRKYGTGYQGRFGREFHLFHTKHTPSSDCIFLKRRRHDDNWQFAVEQSIVNTNGDYIVVGGGNTKQSSGVTAQWDGIIWKWDKDGNYGWHRSLGNNSTDAEYDNAHCIAVDSSSNIYIGGDDSYQSDLYDNNTCTYNTTWVSSGLIAKYNSSGTLQWKKSIRKGSGCRSNSHYNSYDMWINVTSSGNIYSSSTIYNAKSPDSASGGTPECGMSRQGHVMKLNSSGSSQWTRRARTNSVINNGLSYHGCYEMCTFQFCGIDSNENLYTIGYTRAGSPDVGMLTKYNSSGTKQWEKHWHHNTDGPGVGSAKGGIQFDADDNLYICIKWAGTWPIVIHKWNSSGAHQWTKGIKRNNTETNALSVEDFKIDKVRKAIVICGYHLPSGVSRYRSFILRLPIDGSHTGTYGNWVYGDYNHYTHSTNYGSVDMSGILDVHNSGMVERQAYNSYDSESDQPWSESQTIA